MARAGHTSCPLCGTAEIAVTRTGAGTLNVKCHKCEFTGYAKPGTRAARLLAASMVVDADEEQAPAAAPAAKPADAPPVAPAKPEKKPAPAARPRTAFAFDQL